MKVRSLEFRVPEGKEGYVDEAGQAVTRLLASFPPTVKLLTPPSGVPGVISYLDRGCRVLVQYQIKFDRWVGRVEAFTAGGRRKRRG